MLEFEPSVKKQGENNDEYNYMIKMLEGQLSGETDIYANLSNASAIVKAVIDRINWAGFYLMKAGAGAGELVLGPFQGLPACNRIKVGEGVCGTAVATMSTQLVANVHEFSGHIACDSASNSELVVPIIKNDVVYGVLDIDSTEFGRFTQLEKLSLEAFVNKLSEYIDWESL